MNDQESGQVISLGEPANDAMPDNVVALDEHRYDPHLAGEAKCLACGYEWMCVAPAGTYDLECGSCGCMRGRMKFPVDPPSGCMVYRCNCGCDVQHLVSDPSPHGGLYVHCIGCGERLFDHGLDLSGA